MVKGVGQITVMLKLKLLPKHIFEALSLRLEQEMMVIRYVLFCRPSLKTVSVLMLRLSIVGVSCLVFASIQLSSQFLHNPMLNIVILSAFLFIVALFVWEFGYTIQHVKRYGALLGILMMLPLPLYVAIYAQSVEESSPSKFTLVTHSNNETYHLNSAKVGGLRVSYIKPGTQLQEEEDDVDIQPAVTERPLPYPNPFRAGEGTLLGYGLSKDLDLEINIYNMFGNLVEKITIMSGEEGAKKGYNRIKFLGTDASGSKLSAGAYFFFIVHEGKVLSKGKMAVIP